MNSLGWHLIAISDNRLDKIIALCDIDEVEIVWTAAATRQWLNLSADVRRRLETKLVTFARTGQGDVKRLKGRNGARLRVGDWRIIFYTEGGRLVVAAVGHRRDIYE
ncbi:MAG: type II toxin-antitoxin system RelE family toxin [Xanthobacteraceae bacterium]